MPIIELLSEERTVLENLARRAKTAHRLVVRAKIILKLAAGQNNSQVARQLEVDRNTVICWRQRWLQEWETMKEQMSPDKPLKSLIEELLSDKPRPGAPSSFTPEQIVQIMAIACEKPEDASRPISHWSRRELADEAIKRNVVEQISPRSVGRFLKSGGIKTG